MVYLILGTPDSGKSARAEKLVLEIAGNGPKYYIATMIPFGDAGKERVRKHRKMREGKGFETIECPVRVQEALYGKTGCEEATCLLECMSNLVGNEMHEAENLGKTCNELTEYITDCVMSLAAEVKNLVIVANVFPLEGEGYDEDTVKYVTITDMVNKKLKDRVDDVYELI